MAEYSLAYADICNKSAKKSGLEMNLSLASLRTLLVLVGKKYVDL